MSNNYCGIVRATRDPETKSGGLVCFAVADNPVSDKHTTIWIDVCIWDNDRLKKFVVDYVKKGSLLFVSGSLYQREYEGKNYLGINASDVGFATPKPKDNESEQKEPKPKSDKKKSKEEPESEVSGVEDEEIPF